MSDAARTLADSKVAATPPVDLEVAATPPAVDAAAVAPERPAGTGAPALDYDVTIGQVSANRAEFGKTITHYDQCSFGSEAIRIEELSSHHFNSCGAAGLDRLLGTAFVEPVEVANIQAILERHRVAVICGEPDVGKGTLARFAAARLRQQAVPPHPVAETSPLGAEVRVSLLHLGGRASSLGPGIWLFRDFLATGHRDLLRFVEELDALTLGPLSAYLGATGAFLLFTTDAARLLAAQLRLAGLGVLHLTAGPALDDVRALLSRRAEELAQPRDPEERQKVRELVAERGLEIVGALRTPPRVVRFLNCYLLDVALSGMPVEDAISRVDDLGDWLVQGLLTDLDTWSYALALVLSQPHPPHVGAPWLQVHELARAISRHLRRLLRPPRGSGTVIADERRLERLQAEVCRSPFPGVDMARFREDSVPEKLWKVLFESGREVLSLLLPLLHRLAEGQDGGGFAMRAAAARALGRAGEMDARTITFPRISSWSRSEEQVRHLALGQLFQGALGSPVESYRQACLGQLSQTIREASGAAAWAPAVVLREIGCVDLTRAIDGLIRLAGANLGEDGLRLDGQEREVFRLTEDMLRASHAKRGAAKMDLGAGFRQLLTPALCDFERAPQEALAAVQYALVGLCFFHGPVAALLQVANRLSGVEEGRLEPLLALLVLRHEGILDVLERHPLTLAPAASLGASAEMPTSRFLVGAAAEPQGPSDLVKLLALCYHQSGSFPGAFARGLRSRLLELLEDWARQIAEAASFEELWRAGRSLFSALLRGPETELREEVFALLHDNPRLVIPGSQLARLTREALTTPPV